MLFFKFSETDQNHRYRPQLHFRTHYLLPTHFRHLFFAKIGKLFLNKQKKDAVFTASFSKV